MILISPYMLTNSLTLRKEHTPAGRFTFHNSVTSEVWGPMHTRNPAPMWAIFGVDSFSLNIFAK